MKIVLILFALNFITLVQKVAAQAVDPGPAGKADTAKTLSRIGRRREIAANRVHEISPIPPYSGAPAKAARRDARRFRLPKDMVVRLRAGYITANSDYFKPTTATASDTALLADSGYVKTYRFYAFNGAQRQIIHPVGTGLLIGAA